jgi:hypothetical protein
MAAIKEKWWGFKVLLSKREACAWTDPIVNDLASLVAAATGNLYVSIITAAVILQKDYIRQQAEQSGGRGVRLLILWTGIYIGCERRSTGSSPCSSNSGTGGGGSGSGARSPRNTPRPISIK